jgi:hypothetical protein
MLLHALLRYFKALIANRCSSPPGNCIDGVVHDEFVPPRQTVYGHFYVKDLTTLRDAFGSKLRDNWHGVWFLHHDNAPTHTSLVVKQFFAEKRFSFITQPP